MSQVIPLRLTVVQRAYLSAHLRHSKISLRQAFIIVVWIGAFYYFLFAEPLSWESALGGVLIAFAALLPSYLWCAGKVPGLPLFPFFALSYLWAFGLPLLRQDAGLAVYTPSSHLLAALKITGFLLLACLIWYGLVRKEVPPAHYRTLDTKRGDKLFLTACILSTLFMVSVVSGGTAVLDGGVFSLVRGVVGGLLNGAAFALSYRWGKRELSREYILIFSITLVGYLMANLTTTMIVGALTLSMVLLAGFVIGRRKVPWLVLALLALVIVPLHFGKGRMREKYWTFGQQGGTNIQPTEYLSYFAEWYSYSINELFSPESKAANLTERAGLMWILLMVQDLTPDTIPYLDGATYSAIPELFIPRVLYPNKLATQEGTILLNIHYGLQTRETAAATSIGWGLFNEAYANFGVPGITGLALLLGAFYAGFTRWGINAPILSLRFFINITLLTFAVNSEINMGVFVTAFFQSSVPWLLVGLFLMEKRPSVLGGALR